MVLSWCRGVLVVRVPWPGPLARARPGVGLCGGCPFDFDFAVSGLEHLRLAVFEFGFEVLQGALVDHDRAGGLLYAGGVVGHSVSSRGWPGPRGAGPAGG